MELLSSARQQQHDAEAPPPDPEGDHHPLLPPVLVADDPAGGTFPWLTLLGFLFLTFNSAMAVWRSNRERATVFFVGFSYADLVLLYCCLRRYEVSEPVSAERGRLKAAVWGLTTALTLLFSSKVAAVMAPLVAVVVWLMAFVTVAGGFYALFCHVDVEKASLK